MRWGRAFAFAVFSLIGLGTYTATAQWFGSFGGWGYTPYDVIIAQQYSDNRWLQAAAVQRALAAQQRTSDILVGQSLARNQTQAAHAYETQLWWRDHLERQNAQQFRWAELRAVALLAAPEPPPLIRWPSLLQQPRFAAGRANLEAPFRRVQAGGWAVQADEYRRMVAEAQAMKTQVQGAASAVEPHERAAVLAFLDQLAAEATAREKKGSG